LPHVGQRASREDTNAERDCGLAILTTRAIMAG